MPARCVGAHGELSTAWLPRRTCRDHPRCLCACTCHTSIPIGYRSKMRKTGRRAQAEGAGVDGFGLSDFTRRPAPNFFRRCQADADRSEIGNGVRHVKGARTIQGVPPLPAGSHAPAHGPWNQSLVSSRQSLAKLFWIERLKSKAARPHFNQISGLDRLVALSANDHQPPALFSLLLPASAPRASSLPTPP